MLDKINSSLRNLTMVNQWKDTGEVIEWFKNIRNKQCHKFLVFDIKDFYPSISKELLTIALNFAEEKIPLSNEDKKIIFHSRKSLFFNENQAWMKKRGECFDVTVERKCGWSGSV